MNPSRWFMVGVLLILLAGGLVPGAGPTAAQEPFPGEPLALFEGDYFSAAGVCTGCHQNMTDESGTDVSIDAAWRSTMMANAARDPYWRASVAIEAMITPELADVIEDKCATCHMPMARTTLAFQGEKAPVLADGLLSPDHALHTLAMDGNSCTLCHQIEPDALGTAASYSGGYVINSELASGERITYSQFEVGPDLSTMMQTVAGYIPEQGLHVTGAELCGSCHTLYTPYVDANGEIAGEFPEQMPYFEWLHGDLSPDTPCQRCHMPYADGGIVTSITGGDPRQPFSKHNFAGGNFYMQQIYLSFGPEMGVTAGSQHYEATLDRVLRQLQQNAATVEIAEVMLEKERMRADVVIHTLTGHKFPAGFPSRRAFVHFVVTDAEGDTIFESGEFDENGRIADDDHDADPTTYEPHYAVIAADDQVQIYETVMMNSEGTITNILLHGAGYIKNNRLLPAGFDKETARDEIQVIGNAYYDADFVGGSDCIMYTLEVGEAEGPFTVTAELYYLSIGFNWAEKVRGYDTDLTQEFLRYYDATPNTPVLVGSASVTVE